MQYVYLYFNLNVPIPLRVISDNSPKDRNIRTGPVLWFNSNSFTNNVNAVWVRFQNLSNDNFCENEMTRSIVALFIECYVYERACVRLIWLFKLFSVIHNFLSVLILNSKSCILSYKHQTGLWKYNIPS